METDKDIIPEDELKSHFRRTGNKDFMGYYLIMLKKNILPVYLKYMMP
jgi:hypothetical protein